MKTGTRGRSRTKSSAAAAPVPEAVLDLVLVQTGEDGKPSACLQWKPPANMTKPNDISHYYIQISSKLSNEVLEEKEVEGATQLNFPTDMYLEPLRDYIFAVRTVNCNEEVGDLSMVEGCIGMCGSISIGQIRTDWWSSTRKTPITKDSDL